MNNNNVTKKEFNLAMTLIIVMLVVLLITEWITTNAIDTLYKEVIELKVQYPHPTLPSP